MAISGGATVVGAWLDDVGANPDQGSAYVYVSPDSDGDGLDNAAEHTLGTDPFDVDTDDDGLRDWEEVNVRFTDPLDDDSDDDGVLDGNETGGGGGGGFAPLAALQSLQSGTDPLNADSDGDGIQDGTELGLTAPQGTGTDPAVFVPDADPATTTDPTSSDSDGDGLLDGAEDVNGNGQADPGETDASNADTDGDGFSDGDEVAAGTDPTDPLDFPAPQIPALGPWSVGALVALLLGVLRIGRLRWRAS